MPRFTRQCAHESYIPYRRNANTRNRISNRNVTNRNRLASTSLSSQLNELPAVNDSNTRNSISVDDILQAAQNSVVMPPHDATSSTRDDTSNNDDAVVIHDTASDDNSVSTSTHTIDHSTLQLRDDELHTTMSVLQEMLTVSENINGVRTSQINDLQIQNEKLQTLQALLDTISINTTQQPVQAAQRLSTQYESMLHTTLSVLNNVLKSSKYSNEILLEVSKIVFSLSSRE